MSRRRPRKRESSPVALGGEVVQETLPLPFVYYPSHYGTFFEFSQHEDEQPLLCNCTSGPVENYQELREQEPRLEYSDPVRMAPLDGAFPRVLAEMSIERRSAPTEWLVFREKLCHRCNGETPSLRWCHEMYGGTFTQRYGWYTHIAAYRLGVDPRSLRYLADFCPQEIIQDIEKSRRADAEAQEIRSRLEGLLSGPPRPELEGQATYWHNVSVEEGSELRRFERASERARRSVTKRFENIAREEFGFRKVRDQVGSACPGRRSKPRGGR